MGVIDKLFEIYNNDEAYNAEQADEDYLLALTAVEKLLDDKGSDEFYNALFMQERLAFRAGVKTAMRMMYECYSE